jgi:amino acid transporter
MDETTNGDRSEALSMLAAKRPRNLNWFGAGGLLFGDWGTSRLYVLGIAFLVAGRASFWLIAAMSVLILFVGWAYTQVCRIYPDGGGVYTAARHRHPLLGVVGALLLFADYTITASLSAVEAFHYFGLGKHEAAMVATKDPGSHIDLNPEAKEGSKDAPQDELWHLNSPGLWAIVAIVAIGGLNMLGPKHTAGPAMLVAAGMIVITLLIVVFAVPQIDWVNIHLPPPDGRPLHIWEAFVAVVLALSGVEAIASLTGVMKKPVSKTATKAIWVVAIEVAVFNVLLALIVAATQGVGRENHKNDMLAFLGFTYIGPWGEWTVRIIGGILLLSATNTAIGALQGTLYVMSRDGELPRVLQKLNGFGAPIVGGIIAAAVPAVVLLFFHDLEKLAHLYAIGIVGAVAINCLLTAFHPRLRKHWRKVAMVSLGLLLVGIWVTLALTKLHALIFVSIVLAVGLIARQLTHAAAKRKAKTSLLREAIVGQLTTEALMKPKMMLSTAGSSRLAEAALQMAAAHGSALVVSYIREVALNYKVESDTMLTLETDPAAQQLFTRFLDLGHQYNVPIIPMYDTGTNAPELIAEAAAMNGCERVLIGSSRRGAIHHLIKGSFQRKLESLLPPDIPVQVLEEQEPTTPLTEKSAGH